MAAPNNNSLALTAYIEKMIQENQAARTLAVNFQGEFVWIKQATGSKKHFWHKVQWGFAKLLKLPILKPTVACGGDLALQQEVKRLQFLKSQQINVPEVVAMGRNWIALSDIGDSVRDLMRELKEQESTQLAVACARALAELHQQGRWHGRPALRDLTYAEGKVGFIDFEEDVAGVMDLESRQARDVVIFFHNLMRFCPYGSKGAMQAIAAYKANAPLHIKAHLTHFYQKVDNLRSVCKKLKPLAKREIDQTVGLLDCVRALN